jgi:hypothetical protein
VAPEAEANGDSKSTNERGPFLVALSGQVLSANTRYFCTALAALVSPIQNISIHYSPSHSKPGRLCVFLIETEANGDSRSTYKRGPFLVGSSILTLKF